MFSEKLVSDFDFNSYFNGNIYKTLNIGDVLLDTGEIVVCDPLFSLGAGYNKIPPLIQKVPAGKYPVTISVMESEDDCARYMASKISFSNNLPIRFEMALKIGDDPNELDDDMIFGFPVMAGLACICDKHTEELYESYFEDWYSKNPDKNSYDDYFSEIFAKSYLENPQFQREGGDWINWFVPNTHNNVAMYNGGFGDGFYPCYWGYDENNQICCLVTQFIDPSEDDEDEELE